MIPIEDVTDMILYDPGGPDDPGDYDDPDKTL